MLVIAFALIIIIQYGLVTLRHISRSTGMLIRPFYMWVLQQNGVFWCDFGFYHRIYDLSFNDICGFWIRLNRNFKNLNKLGDKF